MGYILRFEPLPELQAFAQRRIGHAKLLGQLLSPVRSAPEGLADPFQLGSDVVVHEKRSWVLPK